MKVLPRVKPFCPALVSAGLALAVGLGLATAVQATAADLYYERSLAMAAHERCRLFEPKLVEALKAARLQAQGAALRSGAEAATLSEAARRARAQVEQRACSDPELARVTARVRAGFNGWLRAARITFPGTKAHWRGDRFAAREPIWRLVQASRVGRAPVQLGLVGRDPATTELVAVVSFVGKSRPYAARLVTRNPAVMPRPWLAADGMAPASARSSYFASQVRAAPTRLLAEGQRQGEQWRFSASAIAALEGLDPRETVRIEFLFRDDSIAPAIFEVGDFAAGRAFLNMGSL